MAAHNVSVCLANRWRKASNIDSIWTGTRAATEVRLLLIMYLLLLLMQLLLLLVRVLARCGVEVLCGHSFLGLTAAHCVLSLVHLRELGLLLASVDASQVVYEGASH